MKHIKPKQGQQPQQLHSVMTFDKTPMLSNQQSVSHGPDKFMIDFKTAFPQFNPDGLPVMAVIHRLIILDPHIAVDFYNMLGNNIKTYEEAFGKIQVPQSILKVKADMQDVQQQVKTTERPDYMG